MPRPSWLTLALACVGPGCGGAPSTGSGLGSDEIPLVIAARCPGDPGCPEGGDGNLLVGFAMREITPLVEPFVDLNGDGIWEPGEPYTDRDGNGRFSAYWMFNSGHQVFGVHDPLWVRCYVLRQNATTVAHCAFDVGGYFYDEAKKIRADLDPALGVDLVLASATHDHSAPDTIGIFGPDSTTSGYVPEWMQLVRRQAVAAIADAVGKLRPAKLALGSIPVEEGANHDMSHLVDDTRDPTIIDNVMHLMQLDDADDGKPIVTVVNWSAHPDSQSHSNRYLSSEFPHYLRQSVEAHTGSPMVYVSGSVGGQIGPGRVRPIADDGTLVPCGERSYRFIEAWAHGIANFAMKAFDQRAPVDAPKLAFRTTRFAVHIENAAYHTAFFLHLFPRTLYGYDPRKPLIRTPDFDNAPLIDTEVAYLTLGPAAIITCPGELLPEHFIGGYDGGRRGTWEPFIHTGPIYDSCDPSRRPTGGGDYPAPPDVTQAPRPPYLFDLMGGEPAHRMVFGLTLDMLGYIVPRYNFYLDPVAPYLSEPPGDSHYEETNSIGPRAEPEIVGTMRQLAMSANVPTSK